MAEDIKRIPTPFSYSSAVVAGNVVYLGLHRGFGENFQDQLKGTLDGIRTTLDQLGLPLGSLVKVSVWLKHIQDLPEMEQLFTLYFDEGCFPARMTSTTEFFDSDCLVMVDGIAYKGSTH